MLPQAPPSRLIVTANSHQMAALSVKVTQNPPAFGEQVAKQRPQSDIRSRFIVIIVRVVGLALGASLGEAPAREAVRIVAVAEGVPALTRNLSRIDGEIASKRRIACGLRVSYGYMRVD